MNGSITVKEKKSKGPVIIIIILVLVIVGLSTYILSDKGIIFTNKEEKTESNKKETTKTDKKDNDDNTTNAIKHTILKVLLSPLFIGLVYGVFLSTTNSISVVFLSIVHI